MSVSTSDHLIPIYTALSSLYFQMTASPSHSSPIPSATPSLLNQTNSLIKFIRNQILEKDASILSCYENIIHLLDSGSLMAKVCKTTDQELFQKAFAYFNESLNHLVGALHQYPINVQFQQKKTCLEGKHLSILQETQQSSAEGSILQDSEPQDNLLRIENQELMKRIEQLEFALRTKEKQLVQTQIKLMNILNDQNSTQKSSAASLKRQLQNARLQIQTMNREFTIEIKKYNEVFRSMEEEIEFLQGGEDSQVIEQLETQIIKLREQRQRDQMIISELREHLAKHQIHYKNHSSNRNRKLYY